MTKETHPGDGPGSVVPNTAASASLQVVVGAVVEVDRLDVTDLEGLVSIRERDGGDPVRVRSRDVDVMAVMIIEEDGVRSGAAINGIVAV